MPSGPTLFDDEEINDGEQPATTAGTTPDTATDTTLGNDEQSETQPPRSRGPNYLFRRAIVVGGVVAVIATAAVVVGQLSGTGGKDSASGAIGTEWNRIVQVDDRTGRAVVDDASGNEVSRIESGVRNPNASGVVDSTLVVAGTERIAVIDIATEEITGFEFGASELVRPAGSALTLIAPQPDSSSGLLVHGPNGDVINTDTFAPVVGARYEFAAARSSPSGRDVLVTDSGNFQSVLFSFDRDEPSFFPGLALAVDADLVVTAQNVGDDATISVFDHMGEPLTTGRTPSVRAGMITDSAVVLVTADGSVITMSSSNGDTSDITRLEVGPVESGDITTSGDRLVVTGTTGTAIVSGDGSVIGTYDTQQPTGAPPMGSTCITTVTLSKTPETQVTVIDTTDGSVLAEGSGNEPVFADATGCIVGIQTETGFDVMTNNDLQQFSNNDSLLTVTLDGTGVVMERDGRIVLLDVGIDAGGDPIDLGPRGRTVHVTQS